MPTLLIKNTPLVLITEQKHNNEENTKIANHDVWINLVKILHGDHEVDKAKMLVFHHKEKEIEKLLKGVKYRKEDIGEGNFCYELKIKDYIFYLKENEGGHLYSDNYEDPELYSGNRLVVETVSHEYQVFLHLSEAKKGLVSKKLGLFC
ncbi:hypothetical protein JKY72_07130 [Candidatus Gracilibacteria bacterium]|nr:hypothetical protein [Candidatus Gracilibacteria bacterium]